MRESETQSVGLSEEERESCSSINAGVQGRKECLGKESTQPEDKSDGLSGGEGYLGVFSGPSMPSCGFLSHIVQRFQPLKLKI